MQTKPQTPTGVTLLVTLAVLIGLFSVGGGAILLTSTDPNIVTLNAGAVVVGILFLVCGIGLFQGRRWAWGLGVLVSVLSIIRNVIEAVQGLIIASVPGILLALGVIYYLMTPPVKAYFGRGSQGTAESASSRASSP